MTLRETLRLYLVTDPDLCRAAGLESTVRAAVAGGVTCVQLRDKSCGTEALVATARALQGALAGTGVPLLVNDDVEAAALADADGAHIGQDDITPAEARARLGPGKILGLSCETAEAVRAAGPEVDYLGLGPVFATATKSDHKAPIGLPGLRELVALSPVPTVAIGGLKAVHAADIRTAGADGLAVVSAICGQPDPKAAAAAFLEAT